MPKPKAKPEKVVPSPWLIMTFFVAAAVRKGATDLPKMVGRTLAFGEPGGGEYWIRAQLPRDGYFTVHSDGRWNYVMGKTKLEGKLQPPHAKGWIQKMIAKGTPGEIAKKDWETYYALRNGK